MITILALLNLALAEQRPSTFAEGIAALQKCYEAICGQDWSDSYPKQVRPYSRPWVSAQPNCGNLATFESTGKKPALMLLPKSHQDTSFHIFKQGNAYKCDAKASGKYLDPTSGATPFEAESPDWRTLEVRISGNELGENGALDLKLYRAKTGFSLMSIAGADKAASSAQPQASGKVCQLDNSLASGKVLQDAMSKILANEVQLTKYYEQVQEMEKSSALARDRDAAVTEVNRGETPEQARAEENTLQTAARFGRRALNAATGNHRGNAKAVSQIEKDELRKHYVNQIRKCLPAKDLRPTAELLLSNYGNTSATGIAPGEIQTDATN